MLALKKILSIFNKHEKRNLFFLFSLMIIAAIAETLSIGLIVPFIGIVTNPELIHEQTILNYLYRFFNFQTNNQFLIFATAIMIIVFLGKNLYLVIFNYLQYRFINNQRALKSQQLLKSYLKRPYEFHLQRNTAELLRNINTEVNRVFESVLIPLFLLLTELLIVFSIATLIIIIEPIASIISITILSLSVWIFLKIFRKKTSDIAIQQQYSNTEMIKWIQQGLGASKEIKVYGKEDFFTNNYAKFSILFANSKRYYETLQQIPRLFIEMIVVTIVMGVMLLIVLRGDNTSTLLSTMALFAMAAFRLMPSINRVVNSITSIRYNLPAVDAIYEDLAYKPNKKNAYVCESVVEKTDKPYYDAIKLENVSYRYPNQMKDAINNVCLEIPIGKSVAFIGSSGAGKTTVIDILLGLLEPNKGSILVDNIELKEQKYIYQKKIGYIPQSIYLSDDSIRSNVAFGVSENEIDEQQVWNCLKDAQLKELIEQMPDGLDTFVGERGVRLSGGQIQRIGIARALYHNPEILFLDEATSALDNETEKEVMSAIDNLKGRKTLIIIAHRLSTIQNCDIVFELENGKVKSIAKL